MNDVAYADVVDRLLEVVPEIRSDYDRGATLWGSGEPLAHVVYGSVFAQFIDQLVTDISKGDDGTLRAILDKSFDLIEELTVSSDFQTRCVIEASVLESLLGDAGGWDRFSKYFRHHTMQMARKVMDAFSGDT